MNPEPDNRWEGHTPCDLRAAGLDERRLGRLAPMPGSAAAALAMAIRKTTGRCVVLVTDSAATLDDMHRNLTALATLRSGEAPSLRSTSEEESVLYFPPWDVLPGGQAKPQVQLVGERLETLGRLQENPRGAVVVTCVQALMQLTLAPAAYRRHVVTLSVGEEHDHTGLVGALEELGYRLGAEVEERGQASVRGGVLDVWSPQADVPVRLEFFGSRLDSAREFEPADQRSRQRGIQTVTLLPVDEWALLHRQPEIRAGLTAWVPKSACYLWAEWASDLSLAGADDACVISGHAERYEQAVSEAGAAEWHRPFRRVWKDIAAQAETRQWFVGAAPEGWADLPPVDPGFRRLRGVASLKRGLWEPDAAEGERKRFLAELDGYRKKGCRVILFFGTAGALERFRETHADWEGDLRLGTLTDSFVNERWKLAHVAESDLLGHRKTLWGRATPDPNRGRPAHREQAGETITDWLSIEPGDLVVHVEHGIGRYLGLYEIETGGKRQESLAVEYAGKAKLYVPLSQTHLLSRYVGVGKRHAQLHRLGDRRWGREKEAAERSVQDLAATMLETQAMRETQEGLAFPPDVPWQHEFEAAFPFQETEDQEKAAADVRQDMESSKAMDRLICGDVGYGKTEIAMRAAFKAVMGGKQVAVLVPTTVLAQQHYETFTDRMGAYPIRIELLCRFRTPAEQEAVVRGLHAGTVDIVIGTHRLIQPDVGFKDLGLAIVDEEQRFGVAHKERLKHLRRLVDILTLTATPIPRTLYMSLMSVRNISMIRTPPMARLPVDTIVTENEERVVREAILREQNRGGQVFYLHNRVMTIEKVREHLQKIVPEARLGVGHGRMPAGELETVMRRFTRGEFDVLLCTTIIESGVDMPNVNTILVDRADRFGMADLYQLRGRVGRSSRKAYAYFLLPKHGVLLDTARQRIRAVMEHTDLGAGFKLAMRDLEIRGAGNLLGPEQSGHIVAIGFELYCQLLRRTIALMKAAASGRPPERTAVGPVIDVDVALDFLDTSAQPENDADSALLPAAYVEDERARVSVYRKIASASSLDELDELREELRDRYGPVPDALGRLLKVAVLRIVAAEKGIRSLEHREEKVMFRRGQDYLMLNQRFPRLRASTTDARLDELMDWLGRVTESGFAIGKPPHNRK